MLFMACRSAPLVLHDPTASFEFLTSSYSADLKNFVLFLLTHPQQPHLNPLVPMAMNSMPGMGVMRKSIDQAFVALAPRMLKEMVRMSRALGRVEAELMKELENGRLFRLITKMNFILERPQYPYSRSMRVVLILMCVCFGV